jgi:hypothetical protein
VLDRLLCIGRVQTVLMDPDRRPLDVGRNNRVVSRRVFQALLLRDGGCAHPGCGSLVGVEAHHVRYWRHGGLTVMANLVLLCRRHHHAQHEGEFEIEALGQGRFRFRRVDGIELPGVVAPHPAGGATALEADHAHVATDEATTGWDGTRSNLSYAVSVLAPGLKTVGRSFDPWAA